MSAWGPWKSRITASVRTTSRINTLLNDSMVVTFDSVRKKKILKASQSVDQDDITDDDNGNKTEIVYLRWNFNMEKIYKIIENTIEGRLQWDRFNRLYDPWRSVKFAESLAIEIREKIKKSSKYKRYRIVCIISILEKQQQGISYRMSFRMDPNKDNFTNFTYESSTYFIVATVAMVYKD